MAAKYDYDKLPLNIQFEIADDIGRDNKENSNKFYPEAHVREGIYSKYVKRLIDLSISTPALVVLLPVNLIIGVVTYFDVGRPVLFKQQRMGKGGKLFTMYKFRNMTNEKDENGVLLRADLRVTKWGKFVRSTSLDELLNFVSIFVGDMSIIGPRPLPVGYKGRFNRYHECRHAVKPGLDCPLRDPDKVMTWENRLENDAWYAQNVSLKTDAKLVWLLVNKALFGKDRKTRAEGVNEGTFVGYFEDGKVMDSNHIPEKYYVEAIERNHWHGKGGND